MAVIQTVLGRSKIAKARSEGIAIPAISQIALGSGGVDVSGNILPVTGLETALSAQVIRKTCTKIKISDTNYRYRIDIAKNTLSGQSISEIGIYDSAGDLIALQNFKAKIIPTDFEMSFEFDDIF